VTVEGSRVALAGPRAEPATKADREATLRARAFSALRAAGLR